MKYRFHSEAEFELIGAVQFYEKCSPPLGSEFLDEVVFPMTVQLVTADQLFVHTVDSDLAI